MRQGCPLSCHLFNLVGQITSSPGDPAVLIAKQLGMEEGLLHKSVYECFCEPETVQLSDY